MTAKLITKTSATKAFQALEKHLDFKVHFILGGGTAMIMAHQFPLATTDIDALPTNVDQVRLSSAIEKVSIELSLPGDWLNPYFSSFSHVLPQDFRDRLVRVYDGSLVSVDSLGAEDMLIMKCFAHRAKDIGHAQALIKLGANLEIVEQQILSLQKKNVKHSQEALDFLDELLEKLGVH